MALVNCASMVEYTAIRPDSSATFSMFDSENKNR